MGFIARPEAAAAVMPDIVFTAVADGGDLYFFGGDIAYLNGYTTHGGTTPALQKAGNVTDAGCYLDRGRDSQFTATDSEAGLPVTVYATTDGSFGCWGGDAPETGNTADVCLDGCSYVVAPS